VKVIVEKLHLRSSDLPSWLLRYCDEDWWVGFTDEEALFAFPLEFMPAVVR
jgi:hypothetical protein